MAQQTLSSSLPDGFEPIRLLGEGGMGQVHLARQTSLGRDVALKVLRPHANHDQAQAEERLQREGRLLASVNHPAIGTVHDRLIERGRQVLVMEYIKGGNLREHVTPGQPLVIDRARPILKTIAEAVDHLHGCGIIHRDLKPENVLLGQQQPVLRHQRCRLATNVGQDCPEKTKLDRNKLRSFTTREVE